MKVVIGVVPGTLKIAPEHWLGCQDIADIPSGSATNIGAAFFRLSSPFNLNVAVINTNTQHNSLVRQTPVASTTLVDD